MTITSSPSHDKKKLMQAGNHQLSASERGGSSAQRLQQGGRVPAKRWDRGAARHWAGHPGSLWDFQHAREFRQCLLGRAPSLRPWAGDGAPSLQRPPGPLLPVAGWSFAPIRGENAKDRTRENSVLSSCVDRVFVLPQQMAKQVTWTWEICGN